MWGPLCVWTVGCVCVMGMCGTWCAVGTHVFGGSMWGGPLCASGVPWTWGKGLVCAGSPICLGIGVCAGSLCVYGVPRVSCSCSLLHVSAQLWVPARAGEFPCWGDWCGVHLCEKVPCEHGSSVGVGVGVRAGFLCTCGVPGPGASVCAGKGSPLCVAGVAGVSACWGFTSARRLPRPRPAPGSAPPLRPHLPHLPPPQDQKLRPSRRAAGFLETEPELPSHLHFRGEGQGSGVRPRDPEPSGN